MSPSPKSSSPADLAGTAQRPPSPLTAHPERPRGLRQEEGSSLGCHTGRMFFSSRTHSQKKVSLLREGVFSLLFLFSPAEGSSWERRMPLERKFLAMRIKYRRVDRAPPKRGCELQSLQQVPGPAAQGLVPGELARQPAPALPPVGQGCLGAAVPRAALAGLDRG